ncbi:DUF3479 domain-containing protein [Candidatus Gracilibacteria bacterium]|nr:DUF3479 domain-containing protein [Candidatus Gracilibacteria bacterium]
MVYDLNIPTTPMRFLFLTIDGNHNAALQKAATLLRERHGVVLELGFYAAAGLRSTHDWERLERDTAAADFIFGARLFGEEWVRPLDALLHRAACPVCIITSNPALIRRTHIGAFDLTKRDEQPGLLAQWIKKLRPQGGSGEAQRQLAILRNLSKVLKLLPGKARDLHTYISAHQYWLQSSPENLYRLLCLLIERYVAGYRGKLPIADPISYPDAALWHPDAAQPFASLREYEAWRGAGLRSHAQTPSATQVGTQQAVPTDVERGRAFVQAKHRTKEQGATSSSTPRQSTPALRPGTVGILTMRSVVLSENTAHLRALIEALEARGLEARVAYAAGLDMRPAVEAFFNTRARAMLICGSMLPALRLSVGRPRASRS